MTERREHDGEVPERFLALIDELLSRDTPAAAPVPFPASRRPSARRRLAAYAAVAAAVLVLAWVGAATLRHSPTAVDTDRAAAPTSPATSQTPGEVAGDVSAAQIAADARIAAEFGLSLGPYVFRDDGSFVLDDQPDLVAIVDDGTLVGYVRSTDLESDGGLVEVTVYAPDGRTVRGTFDEHFVPAAAPTETGD